MTKSIIYYQQLYGINKYSCEDIYEYMNRENYSGKFLESVLYSSQTAIKTYNIYNNNLLFILTIFVFAAALLDIPPQARITITSYFPRL